MPTAPKTIHLVSLGCPKNRVDSEVMLGVALGDGWRHVDDAADAQVIVVNTCGFIGEAKKESIDTIFEMARHKDDGAYRGVALQALDYATGTKLGSLDAWHQWWADNKKTFDVEAAARRRAEQRAEADEKRQRKDEAREKRKERKKEDGDKKGEEEEKPQGG